MCCCLTNCVLICSLVVCWCAALWRGCGLALCVVFVLFVACLVCLRDGVCVSVRVLLVVWLLKCVCVCAVHVFVCVIEFMCIYRVRGCCVCVCGVRVSVSVFIMLFVLSCT